MSDSQSRGVLGRRRRANAPEGQRRSKAYTVKVTESERIALEAKAAEVGVDVPRLLFEAAMNAHVETSAERKAAIAGLFSVNRQVAGIAVNLNQLAKFANSEGVFPAEAREVLLEFRRLSPEIHAVIDRLADA